MPGTSPDILWLSLAAWPTPWGRTHLPRLEVPVPAYELAGLRVVSDVAIEQLEPFAVAEAVPGPPLGAAPAAFDGGTRVYAGPGWVGGRLCQMESWRGQEGYLLKIEGAGAFEVSGDATRAGRRQPISGGQPNDEIVTALLGPCLLLAMALRGVWCLHAAAAGPERSAVALAGDSGFGKSTLAEALATLAAGWRRIADDLLPVRIDDGVTRALPRFPQPKLAPEDQWQAPAPAQVDLAVVYVLDPGGDEVEIEALSRRRAALALVRQTVAAKLFDAELQGSHLDFCTEAARHLEVRRLRFPRRREALPSMVSAIVADLATVQRPAASG